MLVLFLNELSVDPNELPINDARNRVLALLRLLRKIRKEQSQVALNSQQSLKNTLVDQRHSLAELLAGNDYRDEWRFIRGFENRSPLSSDMKNVFCNEIKEMEYHYNDLIGTAIGWGDLLDTGAISFLSEDCWEGSYLEIEKQELDEDAEILSSVIKLRHFSQDEHVQIHKAWLNNYVFIELPKADQLWEQREILFPNIRFLSRSQDDINNMSVSGASYHLVIKRLRELNQDINKWIDTEAEWPSYSSKATPEASQRKRLCNVEDIDRKTYCFDLHLRFTGGIAGRIHFRICSEEKKAIIAYIGRKLDTPIVQ